MSAVDATGTCLSRAETLLQQRKKFRNTVSFEGWLPVDAHRELPIE
jgi:hypothetical protein